MIDFNNPHAIAQKFSDVGASVKSSNPHSYIYGPNNKRANFEQMMDMVKKVLESKEVAASQKLEMLAGFREITEKYEEKSQGRFNRIIGYFHKIVKRLFLSHLYHKPLGMF